MRQQLRLLSLSIGLFVFFISIGQTAGQNTHGTDVAEARAQAVIDRHRPALLKITDVAAVIPSPVEGKIQVHAVIFTDAKGKKPAALPPGIANFPKELEGVPVALAIEYVLPPPPGVIVVKPGGERFRADACPPGSIEATHLRWRFCLDFHQPEAIPPMMYLPIAGIAYEEALKILERHRAELEALPGVQTVSMGLKGISIEAEDLSILPKEVEGLPVEVRPYVEQYIVDN